MKHAPSPPPSAPDQPYSVPRYATLAPDPAAHAHCLVGQSEWAAAFDRFERLSHARSAVTLLLEGRAPATTLAAHCYATFDALAAALHERLCAAKTGLRLYISGDEAFVWRVQHLACAHGLQADEVQATVAGARRPVYCVHCSMVGAYGEDNVVHCRGCGIRLAVRQHFSQRLGGYMGVCADAADPRGERL